MASFFITQGIQGPEGAQGPTGPAGAASNAPGPTGATGPLGATGATGPQGATGPAGTGGSTIIGICVSGDVTVSTLATALAAATVPGGLTLSLGIASILTVPTESMPFAFYPGGTVTGGDPGLYTWDGADLTFMRALVDGDVVLTAQAVSGDYSVLGPLAPIGQVLTIDLDGGGPGGPEPVIATAALNAETLSYQPPAGPPISVQEAIDALDIGGESVLTVYAAAGDGGDDVDLDGAGPANVGLVLVWGRTDNRNGVYDVSIADGWVLVDPQPTTVIAQALIDGSTFDPVLDSGVWSLFTYTEGDWVALGAVPNLGGSGQVWGTTGWFDLALADLPDVDVVSDPPAQDDVLAWDDTENKWTPATLTGGAQNVFTVKSTIAFDLTGLYDLADPAPTPIGWTTAIFGQADPSWNGIWEGQTPAEPHPEDYQPMVKRADLPTENGVIVTEYLSYDMDTLFAPLPGGWIIAQVDAYDTDGGMGTFGALPGDGWAVVYGTQYWLDSITDASAPEVANVYVLATENQVETYFGWTVTETEITFAEAPPGTFRMLVDTSNGSHVWKSYTTDGSTVAPIDADQIVDDGVVKIVLADNDYYAAEASETEPGWSAYGIDGQSSPNRLIPIGGQATDIPLYTNMASAIGELTASDINVGAFTGILNAATPPATVQEALDIVDGLDPVQSDGTILDIVKLTQAEYDLLTPVSTTFYVIVG